MKMKCANCGRKVYANEKCACGQKAPKKCNGGVLANTIICMIFLMIIVFSLVITLSLRTVISKNMIINAIDDVELSEIKIDGRNLDEYIFEEFIDDKRVSVKNVDNLLEEDFIKDFVTDKIAEYQDYFLDEGDMPYITSDDIIELIEDNADIIYEEVGLRFLEKDKKQLRKDLEGLDNFKEESSFFFDSSIGSAVSQTYFSYANIIFLVIMMVVIFVQWFIVYILNARRISKMVFKYGIAVAVPSFIILATAVFAKIVGMNVDIVGKLFDSSLVPFILFSAVMFVLGALMAALGIIVNRNYKKKVKAAAAASASISESGSESGYYGQTEGYMESGYNEQSYGNENSYSGQPANSGQSYKPAGSSNNGSNAQAAYYTQTTGSVSANNVPPSGSKVNSGNTTPSANGGVKGTAQPVSSGANSMGQTVEAKKNICPNCSFENKERALFCCKCGTKLK